MIPFIDQHAHAINDQTNDAIDPYLIASDWACKLLILFTEEPCHHIKRAIQAKALLQFALDSAH